MTAPSDSRIAEILGPHRVALDRCDAVLLDTLRDRLAIIATISKLKHTHQIAVMQHGRIDEIQQKLRTYAAQNDISADLLINIYDLIIGEACRLEDRYIAGLSQSGGDPQNETAAG
ncbi:chorismate mutase [Thalassococcus sp. BH17M4-6]|uniref:chorismate mutase n=1 Tax=Thalassococcus sp. BH17M4-6 TaxID=3413148 RepID=UPI003BD6D6DF